MLEVEKIKPLLAKYELPQEALDALALYCAGLGSTTIAKIIKTSREEAEARLKYCESACSCPLPLFRLEVASALQGRLKP